MQSLTSGLLNQTVNGCLQANVTSLNLEAVTQADSACVGLLLAVRKARQQQGLPALQLRHLPASVQALNSLYELDTLMVAL